MSDHHTNMTSCYEDHSDSDESSQSPTPGQQGSSSTQGHMLPPCKVCGAQATGFHYGINTCEACKGFFRRSMIRTGAYVCIQGKRNCNMIPGKRNLCAYCRYKKCLQVGMSKDGIKTGRYSHATRTKITIEAKQQLHQTEMEDKSIKIRQERGKMAKDLTEKLLHLYNCLIKCCDLEIMMENQRYVIEKKRLMEKLLGPAVSDEDYSYAYDTLGIELDDRKQVVQDAITCWETSIPFFVVLHKSMPGFSDIHPLDKLALFKNGIIETWLIFRYPMMDNTTGFFTSLTGCSMDMNKVFSTAMMEATLKLVQRIKALKLNWEERLLIAAVSLFSPDRCPLHDAAKVELQQLMYVDALEYQMSLRPNGGTIDFANAMVLLTDMRKMTHIYKQETIPRYMRYADNINAPIFFESHTFTEDDH